MAQKFMIVVMKLVAKLEKHLAEISVLFPKNLKLGM